MKWRFKDLLDFEYFLREQGSPGSDRDEADSDRRIYKYCLDKIQGRGDRRELFRCWLSCRRRQAKPASGDRPVLPGEAAEEALSLARWAAGLAGAAAGAGLCGALLAYAGKNPINIFTCLWTIIVPQALLLLLLAGSCFFRFYRPSGPIRGFYPLLADIIRGLIKKILSSRFSGLSAERRARLEAAAGLIGMTRSVYGRILFRPVFVAGQLFGVFFNISIIFLLLLRVAITDLAFGWQSTLQPAPETVHEIVRIISLPWSWFVPESIAHPSVSQIEGSRFVLKEGMQNFATQDLASWWPFLCLAAVFYGLLPRILILACTTYRQKKDISRLGFSHAACDRLLSAMKTPSVKTKGLGQEEKEKQNEEEGMHAAQPRPAMERHEPAEMTGSALVLVPEDISCSGIEKELRKRLGTRFGLDMKALLNCSIDPEQDIPAVKQVLARRQENSSSERLILLQEAWQPPIRENMSWISAIKKASPAQAGIIVGLIGKPADDSIFTRPSDTDRRVWEQAVNSLGDPYIRVEVLGE